MQRQKIVLLSKIADEGSQKTQRGIQLAKEISELEEKESKKVQELSEKISKIMKGKGFQGKNVPQELIEAVETLKRQAKEKDTGPSMYG
ncbi:MAG: hypothetical protein QXO69_00250 [archaeon]